MLVMSGMGTIRWTERQTDGQTDGVQHLMQPDTAVIQKVLFLSNYIKN